MKGKTMADKNNGWNQPETKFPENELEDSFAGFFSEEEEIEVSNKNKKRRKNKNKSGPDILAVSEESDPGFVITEVVALDTGDEVVNIKEEPAEEQPEKNMPEEACAQTEDDSVKADAQAEKESFGETDEPKDDETIVVDLSADSDDETGEKKEKGLFPNARRVIRNKRKHKYAATVGAVLIALAVIGTISVCSVLVNLGSRILDNTRQKEAFEWKVYPLLMFDPATFEDPNQLDEVFILKTSLWSTLLENRTKYSYDENGMLLVPASDLDVAAKSLYGDSVSLKHQTFSEGYEFFYLYSEETNTYSVPISGQTASYVPKVVEIRKNGSEYTLIVGYVAPTTLWNVSEDGSSESIPDKYLYYILEKLENGNYIIKAVRNIPADELPEDLEVSDMQSLNQTQYFDYDEIYQEYLNEQVNGEAESEGEPDADGEESAEGENSEDTSSDESSEDTSSDAE